MRKINTSSPYGISYYCYICLQPDPIPSNVMMRHVQVHLDMLGQLIDRQEAPAIKINDLADTEQRIFELKISEMPQMPESIRVPRNLSLILHNGNLSMSMAWMESLVKPTWACNIQVLYLSVILSVS